MLWIYLASILSYALLSIKAIKSLSFSLRPK
jgi:hypothetical protein